jgi:hypothetical protein
MKVPSFDGPKWALALVLVPAWLLVAPAAAQGVLSPAEISKRIETTFGVRVLRVRRSENEGRATYAVTVMNPGGNYNEAYQVSTLMVEPESGRLISQFRHLPAGYRLSGAPLNSITIDGDGAVIRRLTNRR